MRNYDVIVVGGGTAGALAGIAAAKQGAKTLIVEREDYLGGTATFGIPFLGLQAGNGTVVHSGLVDDLIERLTKERFSPGLVTGAHWNADITGDTFAFSLVPFNPEGLKYVLQQMANEAGCTVLYHSVVIGAGMDGNTLKTIDIWNKSGKTTVAADVFVDCTGDADLCKLAGASFVAKPAVQNSSILLRICNVDLDAFYDAYQSGTFIRGKDTWHSRILFRDDPQASKKVLVHMAGHFHLNDDDKEITFTAVSHKPGDLFLNATRVIGIDGTDAEQVSKGTALERIHAMQIWRDLRDRVHGFENSELVFTSPLGIRESRNIDADYVMTREDVLSGRHFADGIAYGAYPCDIHDPKGGRTQFQFIHNGASYSVPYRSLLPKGINGLLTAGRCIGADHTAMGTIRIMGCVLAQGAAAGTAAGLCIRDRVLPRALDIHRLQEVLRLKVD